jgi:hypothetical protein
MEASREEMVMTHDELLAKIDEQTDFDAGYALGPALRAVMELHKPWPCAQDCCDYCEECDKDNEIGVTYPCPTIQAIEEELA